MELSVDKKIIKDGGRGEWRVEKMSEATRKNRLVNPQLTGGHGDQIGKSQKQDRSTIMVRAPGGTRCHAVENRAVIYVCKPNKHSGRGLPVPPFRLNARGRWDLNITPPLRINPSQTNQSFLVTT